MDNVLDSGWCVKGQLLLHTALPSVESRAKEESGGELTAGAPPWVVKEKEGILRKCITKEMYFCQFCMYLVCKKNVFPMILKWGICLTFEM